MVDERTSGGAPAAFHCPWCSATLPATNLETCPSCGATLTSAPEAALPGVTAVDHDAIARATREPVREPRSRFLSWLSGEYVDDGTPAAPGSIAPPDEAVRREILRLEIEAELADRQAEADSIMADAAVEGRPIPGLTDEPVEADAAAEEVVGDEGEQAEEAESAPAVDANAAELAPEDESDRPG